MARIVRRPSLRAALAVALALALASPAAADETIVFENESTPPRAAEPTEQPTVGAAGGYVLVQGALDTTWEDNGEDVFEARTRAQIELAVRRGETWKLVAQGRLDWVGDVPARGAARSRFEPRLMEAYAAVHHRLFDVRIGNQIVSWSLVDFFGAADFLNPLDLREGLLFADPAPPRVPVPLATVEVPLGASMTFTVAVQPFFTPMRADVFGSDWALLGPNAPASVRAALGELRARIDPTIEPELQESLLSTRRPAASIDNAQIAARLRGGLGAVDYSLAYGFLWQKIPTVRYSEAFRDYVRTGSLLSLAPALVSGEPIVDSFYERFHVVAFDASTTAGPLVLALSVAWTPARTFYRIDPMTSLPEPVSTGVYQFNLHAEVRPLPHLDVVVEALVLSAVGAPADADLVLFGAGRSFAAFLLVARYTMFEDELEWSIMALVDPVGPSYILAPSASWRLPWIEGLRATLGAAFFEGKDRSLGGSFGANDLAYLTLRYAF